MKVFIAFACLCVCAQASLLPAAAITTKLLSTGESSQSRTQDAAGNYAFAYNEQHGDGGSSRKEAGDAWGNKQGSYTLNVADGRQRVVKYVADGAGFRAAISTNEPGTAAQPAAATSISSPYLPPQQVAPLAVAEPLALAAPAVAVAAPVALAEPALGLGYGKALAGPALGYAAPVAIAAVPAVSSYSTAINHAAPVALAAHAAPLAVAAPLGHGLGLGCAGLGCGGHGLGLGLGAKGLY